MTGRQLSHYIVGEKIGEGGMGIVYKGTDTRLKRTVALKFLTKALPIDAAERKRFLREARAASSVNHPNVCVIHAIEEVEGEEFIVMEFVEGQTLRKWANQNRREHRSTLIPLPEIFSLVLQVAEGLYAAHRQGIVHRDVKPENVMVTPDGRAKIMDFGLAKLAGESKLTRSGATIGTVAYMSPEQVQGQEIDAQTDIYSFGVMLYELLAGTTPFQADHVMGMMYAIVSTEPREIREARPGTEPDLARIVMKCMAKDKKARYAELREVIRDITTFEELTRTAHGPIVRGARGGGVSLRSGRLWRFLRKKRLSVGIAALFLLVLAAFFAVEQWPGESAKLTVTSVPPGSPVGVNGKRVDSLRGSVARPDSSTPDRSKAIALEETQRPGPVMSVDLLATELVAQLQRKAGPLKGPVTVRPFTYQDTQTGSEFSRFFKSLLESRIAEMTHWQVVPGDELRGNRIASVGPPAAYEVDGTYWQQARQMRFFARLKDCQTGGNSALGEAVVSSDEMKKEGLPWKPANIQRVLDDAQKLGKPEPETGDLRLELLTNKGAENAMFTEGDTLKTFVRVNKPCTVRVFYHAADGTRFVLTGPDDLKLGASQVNVLVPIDSSTCSAPFGAEILQAFATTDRFEAIRTKLAESGYYTLQSNLESAMVATRGIKKLSSGAALIERRVVITTVPK